MSRYNNYWSKFDVDRILELNQKGLNLTRISEILDIPSRRFIEMCKLKKLSLKTRFKYNINDNFFDNLDSEIKFYLLGYFVADGNMSHEIKKRNGIPYSESYRMCLSVSIDDEDVIELFQNFICPQIPITFTNNQSGVKFHRKTQVHYRWTSKHMFNTLESYNIHPRKTYDYEFELPEFIIEHPFFIHFIRGFIDGDGYINKGYIQLCVNSECFIEQLKTYFLNTFKNITSVKIHNTSSKTCNSFQLFFFGGKKFINEYYLLNKDAKYYLKRKYHNTEVSSEITKGSEIL